jgi:protein-S-isoprenylcysteine O-methyltransferase Ste14
MKNKNSLKNKLAFPPLYFFGFSSIIIILYFLLPEYNMNIFPVNLTGLPPIAAGLFFVIKYNLIFIKEKTTLQNTRPSRFLKQGFYKYSRNPMYLGSLLFITGLSVTVCNLIAFTIPPFFFLVMNFLCIPVEENIMSETFKTHYEEYKKKVRRWL